MIIQDQGVLPGDMAHVAACGQDGIVMVCKIIQIAAGKSFGQPLPDCRLFLRCLGRDIVSRSYRTCLSKTCRI